MLLDFTCGRDNPAMPYIGAAIRDECGLDDDMRAIADVPSRSLLSRLTDHYMQIIANRAPVGFEAEFVNQRGENICYRGILMPFSSDGDTIDFIYGVINWKTVDEASEEARGRCGRADCRARKVLELGPMMPPSRRRSVKPADEARPSVSPADLPMRPAGEQRPPAHFSGKTVRSRNRRERTKLPASHSTTNAGLADRLWAARETAEAVKAGEGRTRAALYRALALAYDFAVAARAEPRRLCRTSRGIGRQGQARAPMTPIVKLVFGIDYDKARLTEFAAALSYAQRQEVVPGNSRTSSRSSPAVSRRWSRAERQARRPVAKADTRGEVARARLRHAAAISLDQLPLADEFAVIVTRRGADGRHEPVAILDDESLIERAIRKAA